MSQYRFANLLYLFGTAVVVLGVMGRAAPASAGEVRKVALQYERGASASHCLEEKQLRQEVAARLGEAPFVPTATQSVQVSLSAVASGGFHARIVITRPGESPRIRQISDPDPSCQQLGEAVIFAVSVAIDPGRALGATQVDSNDKFVEPTSARRREALEAAQTARSNACDDATHEAALASERRQVAPETSPQPRGMGLAPDSIRGLLGGGVVSGSVPGVVGSFSVAAEFGWDALSVQPGLRVDLSGSERVPGGRVEATATTAQLATCGHLQPVFACAVVSAGVLRGTGVDLAKNRADSTWLTSVGARLGGDLGLTGPLSLRLQGEVLAPFNRVTLVVDERDVWQSPVLSAQLGALVVLHFR